MFGDGVAYSILILRYFLFFWAMDDQQGLVAQLTAELEACQARNSEYWGTGNNIQRQISSIQASTANNADNFLFFRPWMISSG